MKIYITVLFALILTILPSSLRAEINSAISIQDRIETQTFFKTTYETIFGKAEYANPEHFQNAIHALPHSKKAHANTLIHGLDTVLPARLLMPFVYWQVVEKNNRKSAEVLLWHALGRLLILRDFIDHPTQGTLEQKNETLGLLRRLCENPNAHSLNFFHNAYAQLYNISGRTLALATTPEALINGIKALPVFSEDFFSSRPYLSDYSHSWLGFIPGNQVELISENQRDQERIQWLNERVIFAGGSLNWNAPYLNINEHPAFKNDPIFRKIREMIDSATDSIFIDIFLFGGTLGASLSRHLVDQTLAKKVINPNFKTILLHDYATNYNMKDEMMPIFTYLRDRINQEPAVKESFILLQANIQRHPPGIPFGLTNLIPKTEEVFKYVQNMNTYYESKIDHSKVIVVDANTDHPQAYFGSKNWTDHSGGYYYDNALWIKGPAASMVQAAYYDDIDAALTLNPEEQKWFYFKEEGFANDRYIFKRKSILDWFKVKQSSIPSSGEQTVRLAEANVDAKIKEVRNMLIDMIRQAENHIYMEQLFLYDKYINDALIKRKIQRPELEIRILADHNGNFGMNGFPNSIFMREMSRAGIKIRARTTQKSTATFPNGKTQDYHQENHRKISSFDGKMMMIGSSNLNPDTLQGSFREFGAEIYDAKEISKFEQSFLKDWEDRQMTQDFEIETFQLKLGKESVSPEISALFNDIAACVLRSKDNLEGRY